MEENVKKTNNSSVMRNKKGAVILLMFFIAIFLFIFLLAGIEVTKIYSVTYDVSTQLTRLVNNALEDNIDDAWRRDGFNYLNKAPANTYIRSNFEFYTETNTTVNPYNLSSGWIMGGKTGGSDERYLYSVRINSAPDMTRGDGSDGGAVNQPSIECDVTIFIEPSINTSMFNMEGFVFQIPLTIRSENIKLTP